MTKEALTLALEALEKYARDFGSSDLSVKAMYVVRQALAQPEQAPVELVKQFSLLLWDYQELERAFEKATGGKLVRKSNTPQRTWVGLADEEVEDSYNPDYKAQTRAIEAKLKEKNT